MPDKGNMRELPEPPDLTAVRVCRGDLAAIAATVWDGPEEAFASLSADSIYAVAELALYQLAASEGETIIELCAVFGGMPEDYMYLDDLALGHEFNTRCLQAVRGGATETGGPDDHEE